MLQPNGSVETEINSKLLASETSYCTANLVNFTFVYVWNIVMGQFCMPFDKIFNEVDNYFKH